MKFVCVTCLLWIAAFSCFGQYEKHKGFIGISGGASIPVGIFKSTSFEEENPGYAMTGFSGFLSSNILITESIGFAGLIGYGSNPYDEATFTENYVQLHPGIEYEFTAGSYDMLNILGGAYVSIPQGMVDINLKGYVGISIAGMPSTTSRSFSGEPGDPHLELETLEGRAPAFTFGGGVNLMIYVAPKMAIILDANYLQTEPEFNAVEVRLYEDGQLTALSGIDFKQKFQVVVVSAGIALTFTN